MQGFVPAVVVREVLLRRTPLRPGAVTGGEAATDFLGTQGDVWDTHRDTLLALVGSVVSQWVFARPHDRRLAGLSVR